MKLMYCIHCGDVLALRYIRRACSCGKSIGRSTLHVEAEVSGPCVVLGVKDDALMDAVEASPRADGMGVEVMVLAVPERVTSVRCAIGAAGVRRADSEGD